MTLPRKSTDERNVDETKRARLEELILMWLPTPPEAPKEQEPPKTDHLFKPTVKP
jgi:hypothetical protein